MILMVNGTLQSEFFTMFWPTRFTYSLMTGSVMNFELFSISMEYILPILISVSTEYQLPIPRAPISRFPTAFTSSMLPGFTLIFWLPGSTTFSRLTAVAGVSPPTGVVPGAGAFPGVVVCGVSPPTGVVPGAWVVGGMVDGRLLPAVGALPVEVLPGAVWSAGIVCAGVLPAVVPGVALDDVDCDQIPVARASDSPATTVALEPMKCARMPDLQRG